MSYSHVSLGKKLVDAVDDISVERLLKAVVKAARQMLTASNLQSGFADVLTTLCESMDQTRVLLFQHDEQKGGAFLIQESLFSGCPSVLGKYPALLLDMDFPEVIGPMLRGEIYTSSTAAKSAKNYTINSVTGTAIDLMVPIFVDQKYWGNICFDRIGSERSFSDAEINVLYGASAVLASAIEKDIRETETRVELLRRDALNSALVKCNTVLLEAGDFFQSVEAALDCLRETAEMQCVKLIQVLDASVENGEWELISEAVAEGYPKQKTSSIARGPNGLVAAPLQAFLNGVNWLEGDPASFNCELYDIADKELNVQYSICFRICIEDQLWGVLALDDCLSNRSRSNAEKQVLMAAARAFGLAIDRYKKQQKIIGVEQSRAIVAEKARAAEERRRKLLETVTAVSEQLLATSSWYEHAEDIAKKVGLALGVDRLCFGQFVKPDQVSRLGYLDFVIEWVRSPIARQTDTPDLKLVSLDPYEQVFVELYQGKPIQLHTDEISTKRGRSQQEATGAKSQFQYPIMVDGELWGTIGADDCHGQREWPEEEISTIQILASAFANVIKREQLTKQRMDIERQRLEELRNTNEALAGSMQALSESATPERVVNWIAGLMARTLDGKAAAVFVVNDKERRLELFETVDDNTQALFGAKIKTIALDDVIAWEHIILNIEPTLIHALNTSHIGVSPIDRKNVPKEKINEWLINFPLRMNGQPRWLIAVLTRGRSKPSASSLELFKTLSHQLMLALELKRLGDASSEALVAEARTQAENQSLEERAKLAGQIHDTLAQGFTGTMLHLEALIVRLKRGDKISPQALEKVRKIAAFGLAEARRTAVTMRPLKLDGRSFHTALHQLVERSCIPDLLNCTIQITGSPKKIPYAIEEMFLCIAHEAFNNAIRHAHASCIETYLYHRKNSVAIVIKDNGRGFDTSLLETSGHTFGLAGMSKRASESSADFKVISQRDNGTEISVEWREPR